MSHYRIKPCIKSRRKKSLFAARSLSSVYGWPTGVAFSEYRSFTWGTFLKHFLALEGANLKRTWDPKLKSCLKGFEEFLGTWTTFFKYLSSFEHPSIGLEVTRSGQKSLKNAPPFKIWKCPPVTESNWGCFVMSNLQAFFPLLWIWKPSNYIFLGARKNYAFFVRSKSNFFILL